VSVQIQHKGWYSRGQLPHFDAPGQVQAITFRLADSLPKAYWDRLERYAPGSSVRRQNHFQMHLDAGHGSCALRDPSVASLVERTLLFFDGERYCMLAWVVMPNHVHVLAETMQGYTLASIVQSWKSYTAHRANDLLDRSGTFWQKDYYDRYIRDERHLERAVRYVHDNPVLAGLAERPQDWPFSSARYLAAPDATLHIPWERQPKQCGGTDT